MPNAGKLQLSGVTIIDMRKPDSVASFSLLHLHG